MFGKRFANPYVLTLFSAYEKYEVITGGIVRVEEVGDDAQEAEAARKYNELIVVSQFLEDVLLEFLTSSSVLLWAETVELGYQGQ